MRDGRWDFQNLPTGVSEEESLSFESPYGCSKGAADQYVIEKPGDLCDLVSEAYLSSNNTSTNRQADRVFEALGFASYHRGIGKFSFSPLLSPC